MFAFAVWDDRDRTLTLCTDPFGEKPVYWCRDGERLVFASDVRALREADPSLGTPRESALGPFLALGTMPAVDASFFARVQRLPGRARPARSRTAGWTCAATGRPREVPVPASYAGCGRRAARAARRLDPPAAAQRRAGRHVAERRRRLVGDRRARRRARVRCHAPRVHGELPGLRARRVGATRPRSRAPPGCSSITRSRRPPSELLDDLDTLVRDQEEPFGSLSIYAQWRVNRAAHDAGVTVLLDGQGGDELFGGYPGTAGWALRSQGARSAARAVVSGRGERAPRRPDGGRRRRAAALRRAPPPPRLRVALHAGRAGRRGGPASSPACRPARTAARRCGASCCASASRRACRSCCATPTATRWRTAARCACRCSIAASRSSRCPRRREYLYAGGWTKRILRDAVRDVVPGGDPGPPRQGRLRAAAGALARRTGGRGADPRGAARSRGPGPRPVRDRADRGRRARRRLARSGRRSGER